MLVDHLKKKKERIQKFKETGGSRCIYQNKLEKACFKHDTAYGDFKDLTRRTASDKTLRDILLKIQNMIDIKRILLQWFTNLLIKRLLVVVLKMKKCQTSNLQKN